MKIYIAKNELNDIVGYALYPTEICNIEIDITKDEFDIFSKFSNSYKYENNILKISNADFIKQLCKRKCIEKYNAYVKGIDSRDLYERHLHNAIREELRLFVKDNEMPTPIFDMYAIGIGLTLSTELKQQHYQEILHLDLALADLIAQKQKMFKFIDECPDLEVLFEFEPNFNFLSYSNMRWR